MSVIERYTRLSRYGRRGKRKAKDGYCVYKVEGGVCTLCPPG